MKYLLVLVFCIMSCLRAMPQVKFVESWIYSNISLSRGAQTSLLNHGYTVTYLYQEEHKHSQ